MLGIYVRLSKEDEESSSIQNQIKEGKDFAKLHNYKQYTIYNEGEGVSGSKDIEDRPILSQLVKDISAGTLKAVWARNQNRIERSNYVYGFFIRLVKKNKVRVFFADKEMDFNDPTQNLMGTFLSGINQYQLELQSVQVKKVLRNRAMEGKVVGPVAFGYKADENGYQVIDEEKAPIVKEMFERYSKGESMPQIGLDFEKRNIPFKFANRIKTGKWSTTSLYDMLKSTTYIGEKIYNGEIVPVPAIIDKDTFNRTQAQLKKKAVKNSTRHFYILNKLLKCGICGHNITGRSYGKNRHKYYTCTQKRYGADTCESKLVQVNALDELIWNELFTDDTLYQEVTKAYLQGGTELERKKTILNINHYKKQEEKYINQLSRVKEMIVENIYSIKEGKEKTQEIQIAITNIKDKLKEENLNLNNISKSRVLMEEIAKDLQYVTKKTISNQFLTKQNNLKKNKLIEQNNISQEQIKTLFQPVEDKEEIINLNDWVKEDNKKIIENDPKEKARIIHKYIKEIIINPIETSEFNIKILFNLPIPAKSLILNHFE